MCTCMSVLLYVIIIGYVSLVTCFECPHSFKREDGTCCKSAICEKDEQFKYCTETKSIGMDNCKHCPPGTGNTESVNTSYVYNKLDGGTYNRCLILNCKCPDGARIVECAYNILDVKCECNTPWNYGPDPNTCNKSTQEQLRLQRRAGFELLQDGIVRECKEGMYKLYNDNSSCIPHTSCKDDEVILRPGSSTQNVHCGKKDVYLSTTTENPPDNVDKDTGIITLLGWPKIAVIIIIVVIVCGVAIFLLIYICIWKRKSCCAFNKKRHGYSLAKQKDAQVKVEMSDDSGISSQSQDSVNNGCSDTSVKFTCVLNVSNEELGQSDNKSYTGQSTNDTDTKTYTQDTSVVTSDSQNSGEITDYTSNTSNTQSTSVKTLNTQESTSSTRLSTQDDSVRTMSSLNQTGHTDSLTSSSTPTTPSTQNDSVRTSFKPQNSVKDNVSSGLGWNNKLINATGRAQRPTQKVSPMTRAVDLVDTGRIAQPVNHTAGGRVCIGSRLGNSIHDNIQSQPEGARGDGQYNQFYQESPSLDHESYPESHREDNNLHFPENPVDPPEDIQSESSRLLSDLLNGDTLNIDMSDTSEHHESHQDSNLQSPEDIQSESSRLLSDLLNGGTLNLDTSDTSELSSDDLLLRVTPNTDDSSNVNEETGLKS